MDWAAGPSWLSGLTGLLLGRRWEWLLGLRDLGRAAESWTGPLWVARLLAATSAGPEKRNRRLAKKKTKQRRRKEAVQGG
ncbi:hypothetical protein CRG98_008729 [Punica granatum]|uniref:Uncharacterized protein n=1 Tax=Punica granatum TaxID=22663 RepID=A0A2I0KQQ7_PUNGR|nr:hypothetical protein CRG98_008729 [Punica granatum]